MILASEYLNGVDKVWYQSSTVVFTKFVENPNDNRGQLYVTFKGGATYWYKDVDMPTHYLQFKHEMNEGSSGKSLNRFIKPNYEYEKIADENIEDLHRQMDRVIAKTNKKHTYFISGSKNITPEQFEMYYQSEIDVIVSSDFECKFIIGDSEGVDKMAQDYLVDGLCFDADRIAVYCTGETPEFINQNITNIVNGFENKEEMNKAMTEASIRDIAFIAVDEQDSETARNILRRHTIY